MNILAIDVGSSSVKIGLLRNGRLVGSPAREVFHTHYAPGIAEVEGPAVIGAIGAALRRLPASRTSVDLIALDTMAASWIAMDRKGEPITPVITHQDRRSVEIAKEIEAKVGKVRHLGIAGVRPIPGGISSTTCAWFIRNQKSLMKRADLVGHLQTYLHRTLCGTRVVDYSHASFMGLYETIKQGTWDDSLCEVVGISKKLLPEILPANQIGGKLTADGSRRLGLPAGLPMLAGMIDTGGAMLLTGAKAGQLVNVVGSTDVLALCTDKPKPHEKLLTRALGISGKWVSVGTIAAAGSSLNWAKEQLFSDLSEKGFFALVLKLSRDAQARGAVRFDPYLAGDRSAVEQRQAAFSGLTLSTTRQQMLAAIIEALAEASAGRLKSLKETGTSIARDVLISGGGGGALAKIMHRDWPGQWNFKAKSEATLLGLAKLADCASVG